jgi:hypothetical protein
VRLQIIIALVAGLILVAVPLYLWRRPRPESIPSADAAVVDAGAAETGAGNMIVSFDAGPAGGITVGAPTTIRCENPGPGKTPPERCDHVTFFEDSLAKTLRDNVACAPASKASFTVSFVMETDFRQKKLNLFAGKSSSLKRAKAQQLLRCIKKAMPTPDWATISHQYARYKVNVLATYAANDSL